MTEMIVALKKHNEEINKFVNECIIDALLLLLKEKPCEKISVTELCKRAGVSRMAYYSNFSSIEDVLDKAIFKMHVEMIEKIGSPFRKACKEEWYIALFEYIKASSPTLMLIFEAGYKHRYLSIVNDIALKDKTLSEKMKYQRLMWAGAIVNVAINWIDSGLKDDIYKMARFCLENFSDWTMQSENEL